MAANGRQQFASTNVIVLQQRANAMAGAAKARAHTASVPGKNVPNAAGFDLAQASNDHPALLEPEYPFRWAGLYGCGPGEYLLELMPGRKSVMSIVLLQPDLYDGAPIVLLAELAARIFAHGPVDRAAGQAVLHGELHQRLLLHRRQSTRFRVSLPKAGRYVLFTEHRQEDFDLRLVGPALLAQWELERRV